MIGSETSKKIGKSLKRTRIDLKASEIEEANEAITEDGSDYDQKDLSDYSEVENNISELSVDAKSTSNAGWADVMQKILKTKKPKRKKSVVLAKAKKLCDIKKKEDISSEINGVKERIKTKSEQVSVETEKSTVQIKQRKKETNFGIRIKPSIVDRERERMLQKIATKGVVQLFNAVRQQQTEISKKLSQAGPLERKREQVLKSIDKNAFLDILMGGSKGPPVDNADKAERTVEQIENKEKGDKIWSVLRDDFVMGAKLKDWDKKDETEEDSSASEDMDSDD